MHQITKRIFMVVVFSLTFIGKGNAATSVNSIFVNSNNSDVFQKEEEKTTGCLLERCVNIPQIPANYAKLPNVKSGGTQEKFSLTNNEKPATILTGKWIVRGAKFTITNRGCTAGATGQITNNGKNIDHGYEINITQNNNHLVIPDQVISYSGPSNNSYMAHSKGKVSGNRVEFIGWGNLPAGTYIHRSMATISDDGNTITGKVLCKSNSGSETAEGTFYMTRKTGKNPMLEQQKKVEQQKRLEQQQKAEHQKKVEHYKKVEQQKKVEHYKKVEQQRRLEQQQKAEHQKKVEHYKKVEYQKKVEQYKKVDQQKKLGQHKVDHSKVDKATKSN